MCMRMHVHVCTCARVHASVFVFVHVCVIVRALQPVLSKIECTKHKAEKVNKGQGALRPTFYIHRQLH